MASNGSTRSVNFSGNKVKGGEANVKPSFTNPSKTSAPSLKSVKTAPNCDKERGLR